MKSLFLGTLIIISQVAMAEEIEQVRVLTHKCLEISEDSHTYTSRGMKDFSIPFEGNQTFEYSTRTSDEFPEPEQVKVKIRSYNVDGEDMYSISVEARDQSGLLVARGEAINKRGNFVYSKFGGCSDDKLGYEIWIYSEGE